MVIIQLKNNVDWYRTGWIYKQLISDVIKLIPNDEELKTTLTYGGAIGTLFVNELEEPVRSRVLRTLKATSRQTIDGRLPDWNPRKSDAEGRKMYLAAITELLDTINREFPDLGNGTGKE